MQNSESPVIFRQQHDRLWLPLLAGAVSAAAVSAVAVWAAMRGPAGDRAHAADAAFRDAYARTMAQSVAKIDVELAAVFAADLPPGPAQERAAVAGVQRWADADPRAAAAWADSFSGAVKTKAVNQVVQRWALSEPEAGGAWAAGLAEVGGGALAAGHRLERGSEETAAAREITSRNRSVAGVRLQSVCGCVSVCGGGRS